MALISFSQAESSCNRQMAMAYVVYMILGSFYGKCQMENRRQESRLRTEYYFMKTNAQYRAEEQIDRICRTAVPEDIADLHCSASVFNNGDEIILKFQTGIPGTEMQCAVMPDGFVRLAA